MRRSTYNTHLFILYLRNLNRYGDELLGIDVYRSNVNGPRGGEDKKAVMRASLRGLPPISISTEHDDLYVAISRSAKRIQRAVKRSLRKSHRVEPRRVLELRRLSPEPLGS
jgi:ribosome-associated translation inhibitor RaiA